jgi:hypothetical protein
MLKIPSLSHDTRSDKAEDGYLSFKHIEDENGVACTYSSVCHWFLRDSKATMVRNGVSITWASLDDENESHKATGFSTTASPFYHAMSESST